ncbi:hypothetical protein, partial [Syntrophomonas wolfei]|uniref:hypothetical protein n=1 Tax=Syntrophomonas wolfei TaxID=863 RepID=UPI001A9A4C0F
LSRRPVARPLSPARLRRALQPCFANARFVYLCNPYATKGVFAVESPYATKRFFAAESLFPYFFYNVSIKNRILHLLGEIDNKEKHTHSSGY